MVSPAPGRGNEFRSLHREHIVQVYSQTEDLADTLSAYAVEALEREHAMIFIATRSNCRRFRTAIEARGVDVRMAVDRGQFVFVTVEDILPRILKEDRPDKTQFERIARTLVARCRREGRFRHVHIYGELVNTLWQSGNKNATVELEELWNGLRKTEDFTLYCGYRSDQPLARTIEGELAGPIMTHTCLVQPLPRIVDAPPRARTLDLKQFKTRRHEFSTTIKAMPRTNSV